MNNQWGEPLVLTIGEVLRDAAARQPDKTAVVFEDGESVTYRQVLERAYRVGNGLAHLGVTHGDRVVMMLENRQELIDTWFGSALLGAIEVPLNTALRGEFLRHQLAVCRPRVIVAEGEYLERVLAVADALDLSGVSAVVALDAAPDVVDRLRRYAPVCGLDDLLGEATAPEPTEPVRYDDPAAIIFTSGTTGPSKGPLFTQSFLLRFADQVATLRGLTADDVTFTPLPMFHLNAQAATVLGTVLRGATAVLARRFSVSRFWESTRRWQATQSLILGSMVVMLHKEPERAEDADNPLRVILSAPIPAEIQQPFADRFGIDWVTVYGMSETGITTCYEPDEAPAPGAVGRPSPLLDVALVDDEDRLVKAGEVGEFMVRPRAPHVMFEGYFGMPAETFESYRHLWYHTGDLGRFDDEGLFYFVDRKKDAIRRRGENISSFEIERAVLQHDEVADVAAHAVPSDVSEDDVKICVVLRAGATVTEPEVFEFCCDNMPFYAVPRYIEFVAELPRNPVGRVLKYELRAAVDGQHRTWDRVAAGVDAPRR